MWHVIVREIEADKCHLELVRECPELRNHTSNQSIVSQRGQNHKGKKDYSSRKRGHSPYDTESWRPVNIGLPLEGKVTVSAPTRNRSPGFLPLQNSLASADMAGEFTIKVSRVIEFENNRVYQQLINRERFVEFAFDIPIGITVDAPLKSLAVEIDPSWDFFLLLVRNN